MNAVDEMTQTALMVAIARGQAAAKAQDGSLGEVLDRLDKKVMDDILGKLDQGKTVPTDEALFAWQQLLANRRLRRELIRRETTGVAAAVAVKPTMDMEE